MKFLLFIGTAPDAEPYDPAIDDIDEWVTENDSRGRRIIGDRLADESTIVRKRGGEVLVTDGPFAEAKEWIVGFDVIEAAHREEAIAVAAAHPMARNGLVAIREFWGDRED